VLRKLLDVPGAYGFPYPDVICDRCGRNNPENLAFCQDCGRRLAAQTGLVPPAPTAGVGAIPLPSEFEAAGASRLLRPEAPSLSFEDDGSPTCAGCGTRNPPGNRFCVACGARLATAAIPLAGAAAPHQLASTEAFIAVPVGASVSATPNARIVCSRCNGASDPTMVYCQFCGANLHPPGAAAAAGAQEPQREIIQAEGRVTSAEAIPLWTPAAQGSGTDASGRLVTVARDGAEGATYPLTGETIDVGREEGNVLLREDAYISPRHLRLTRRDGTWHAQDLGSVNGVYLRVRKAHVLMDGDLLLVGLQVLRFEAVKDAEQGFGPATQHGTLLFGSPLLPRYGRLCERTVEGVTRNVFYLHRDETIIGRESGDIVFTDDPFMSRRHASIRLDVGTTTLTLTDLASSNGTYVAMRGQVALSHGDFLRLGQHLFRVDLAASRPAPIGGSPLGGARRGT
jgi:pSer/pThr/pTyr-binding forkhead associated (FHA) protein